MGFSALIRSEQMSRNDVFKILEDPPEFDINMDKLFMKRFKLSEQEFVEILSSNIRKSSEFKTYKKLFKGLDGFFILWLRWGICH